MMQTALQRSGHLPYSMFVATGVLLLAATAYPKSLDQDAFSIGKSKTVGAQCVAPSEAGSMPPRF